MQSLSGDRNPISKESQKNKLKINEAM